MNLIDHASIYLDKFTRFFLAVSMALMVIVVLFGVINRFIFQVSYSWMDEAARYLMIWSCMLGSAIAMRAGVHIGLTILISKLKRNQFWVILLNHMLVIIFLAAVTIYGTTLSFSQMSRHSPTLGISMFWVLIAVPTGSSIMIIHSLSSIIELFQNRKKLKVP